jgi:tetratricopeptide (TPR) repeat protein
VSDVLQDDLEQEARREQLGRLVLNARLFLRQSRLPEAQAAIDELRSLDESSSEAWELQGDLHRHQGERSAARSAYQQATRLDPANASAERKYAEVVLYLGEQDRARREQRLLVDTPGKRPEKRRNPTFAILYACLFPGLGQLYNRQHEKGLGLFFAAAIILILLLNGIILAPYHGIPEAGRGQGLTFGEQFAMWGENLRAIPWWHWVLAVLGLMVFVTMHLYSIFDAGMVARREAAEADRLGIDAPA